MHILITGGTGYIGSHTAVELLDKGYRVTIADNLANSDKEVIQRIKKITGKDIGFVLLDLCDKEQTKELFINNTFDAVIHFAGLKAVGESVLHPLDYYENNLLSTISVLEAMEKSGVNKFIFSSSATVYGETSTIKYVETLPVGNKISSPYGWTKFMIEKILEDVSRSNPNLEITILRYFNPIGAHESGLIGEDPNGIPNNLMPFIAQVASGRRDKLQIFGNDYPTQDGTCRRDYIHVVDLARGHVAALEHLKAGVSIYNLGSGTPVSVLELLHTFIHTNGVDVPYEFAPRRMGDLPEYYADPTKAHRELGWKTVKSVKDMCSDTWNWQFKNPYGYKKPD